ncbi:MAG: DNA-formamidopyrimidine glycosylase family protein [Myxococcota bacterium]
MPELPEAQLAADVFAATFGGRRLTEVHVARPGMLRQPEAEFREALVGRVVGALARVGKHIVARLDGQQTAFDPRTFEGPMMALHLGMSGKLVEKVDAGETKYVRVQWRAEDARLSLVDMRTLGRLCAGAAADVRAATGLERLGPDALLITEGAALLAALGQGKRLIKTKLMDQARIAGLGNIQVCEALFRARLNPSLRTLTSDQADALARAIQETLTQTLEQTRPPPGQPIRYLSDGAHIPNPFLVYAREGQSCTACGTTIERCRQDGRSTFHCPSCQA